MKRVKILWFLGLLLLLSLPAGTALAAEGSNPWDRIITGDDYILDDGETERGDVVVMGGSARIREGAVLDGNLVVFGGDVEVEGRVDGDIIVMGGDVDILGTADIGGDCVLIGGNAAIDESATIEGSVLTNPQEEWFSWSEKNRATPEMPRLPETPEIPAVPPIPDIPERPRVVYHSRPTFASRVGSAVISAILIGLAALVITLIWPKHSAQVRQTIVQEPATSGLVGFLTLLGAALLTPILVIISAVLTIVCIGLLGIPIIILLWLVIGAAALFGWAAMGQLVGRWLGRRLNISGMSQMLEAGLGAFVLSLALGTLQVIWCLGVIGVLLHLLVLSLGVGATIMTRFGRRSYQSGQPILPQWPGDGGSRPATGPATPVPVEPVEPAEPAAPAEPVTPIEPAEPAEPAEPEAKFDFEAPPLEDEGPHPDR